MEQKRFVIVLSPDELEPPKVGFNDEVEIQIEESSSESPTRQYIIRFQFPLRLLFELGSLPCIISCALFKYTDYTLLPVDIFNLIVCIICSYNFRKSQTLNERPVEVYTASSPFIVSVGYIQLLLSAVCLLQSYFITMSISFYQYVLIQILLFTQYIEERN